MSSTNNQLHWVSVAPTQVGAALWQKGVFFYAVTMNLDLLMSHWSMYDTRSLCGRLRLMSLKDV